MTRRRHPRGASTRSTPEDILADFPPDVRAVASALRELIIRTIPTASEHAYPGWRGIGYRDPQSGYFCGVFPQRDHVKLGFEHGTVLPDPEGVLEGTGRQVRYLIVPSGRKLPRRTIVNLLRAAVLHGAVR
jgi:hypothetical protein